MTKQKTTKRALLSSALALVLCLSMLIGTTFAWFTDSVTSSGNIIKSGNLDAELNYKNKLADNWNDASKGAIFNYDKWEPGYVDLKYVQVKNAGNLAFKYLLSIIPEVIPEAGETNLADVIDVYVWAKPTEEIERADIASMTKVGTLTSLMTDPDGAARGILLPAGANKDVDNLTADEKAITEVGEITMAIALKMQESAGNEYQNLLVGGGFKVELLATQYMYEKDSFDDTYDKDSKWPGEVATAAELQSALNAGGEIKLIADIASAEDYVVLPEGKTATINLNGHTLTNDTGIVIRNYGNLTLTGEGTIDGGINHYAIYSDKGSVTIDEMVVVAGGFGAMALYGDTNAVINNATLTAEGKTANTCHLIWASGNSTLEINGGTYTHNTSGTIDSGHVVTSYSNAKVTINGGTFKGGYVATVSEYSSTSNIEVKGGSFAINPKNYVAVGHSVVQSNGMYVVIAASNATEVAPGLYKDDASEYHVVSGAGLNALNTSWANNENRNAVINLVADIDYTGYTWTMLESHSDTKTSLKELNGNGYTIRNLTINGQAMFKRFAGSGDVTVKDITFDNAKVTTSGINASILTVQTYQNVLLDNVDVKNSTITGAYKVAPLIGSVYNESSTSIIATLKNCDVSNCVVKSTSYDFFTAGMVAFVYESNNDKIVFENCTVTDVTLTGPTAYYDLHAFVYCDDKDEDNLHNEVEGVTVTNCKFEAL